jgi:hypothetical protein
MKGIINLRGYKIIVDESIHAGKYCFKAQHDRERTFYFYTETEESMRTWLKMLLKTTIARDFKAPVMSSNHIATVSLDVARKMRPRPPSVIMYNQQHQTAVVQPNVIMEEEETAPLPDFLRNDTINEDEDLIDPQHRSLPPLDQQSVTSSISDHAPNHRAHEYLDWVNSYMRQGRKVNDLTTAFRNGETLINLLEAISNKEVRRPPPQKGGAVSVMMLDNIVAAFKFMGRDGVQVDGQYTIKGNEYLI